VSPVLAVSTNPFGEAVGYLTSRRDLDGVDARAGQDGVERRGELAGPVADEAPEGAAMVVEVHQQVPGLLGGPGSGRMARRPEDVHMVEACARRNCRWYRWTGTLPEVSAAA
jgi:hypothetical protein